MDVGKMQTKLATWADDPSFRFDDIYNLVYELDWLYRAFRSVKSNKGSRTAGVDGRSVRDFEEDLDENLKDLREELKAEAFDPKPVRRTYIPKGDGRERPLGIPTVKDRIVQESLRMVLEPIYEQDFSDHSFGFRPNRRTHDAIKATKLPMTEPAKMEWVIDADIKGFFDNVNHQTLEQIVQDRITDRKVRDLIWKFLKAGIMEDGSFRESMLGTPQGGIVSPLLANVYLNELDQWVKRWTDLTLTECSRRRQRGKGNWNYVRYADDFLLLTNGTKERAEKMKERVADFVSEELDLTLSDKKTEIVHARDGVDFLGYRIQKTSNGGVRKLIPKEAKNDIRGKVRAATEGDTDVSVRSKIKALNGVLRGWAGYYKFANNQGTTFNNLDHFVWEQVTDWLARKYRTSVKKVCKHKLDQSHPLTINGVTLFQTRDFGDSYTQSILDKEKPYLGDGRYEEEELPDPNPWLGNQEGRNLDLRWQALNRDNWTCQDCGEPLGHDNAEVHHKRDYAGYSDPKEADRLENVVSLCGKCHSERENRRERTYAK